MRFQNFHASVFPHRTAWDSICWLGLCYPRDKLQAVSFFATAQAADPAYVCLYASPLCSAHRAWLQIGAVARSSRPFGESGSDWCLPNSRKSELIRSGPSAITAFLWLSSSFEKHSLLGMSRPVRSISHPGSSRACDYARFLAANFGMGALKTSLSSLPSSSSSFPDSPRLAPATSQPGYREPMVVSVSVPVLPGLRKAPTHSACHLDDGLVIYGEAHLNLPKRPRRFFLPVLVICIIFRLELFNRITFDLQCSTPGLEVSLLPLNTCCPFDLADAARHSFCSSLYYMNCFPDEGVDMGLRSRRRMTSSQTLFSTTSPDGSGPRRRCSS